jgi:Uma2 family endonuclease
MTRINGSVDVVNLDDFLNGLDERLRKLGDIPRHRVCMNPLPGTATEKDMLRLHSRTGKLYELVDGTLVEKVMGFKESPLASGLIIHLGAYAQRHRLGTVTGEAGTIRLMTGLVRIPDVAFTSWDRLPGRRVPDEPTPGVAPDLVVEVLSRANTRSEMRRKLKEYFLADVRLVWFVDPQKVSVRVFSSPDTSTTFSEGDTLTGGEVIPGYSFSIRDWFACLSDTADTRPVKRK